MLLVCRGALVQGPPGLTFVGYGNSTSVTTSYGQATAEPLLPCTSLSNTQVAYLTKHTHVCICEAMHTHTDTDRYTYFSAAQWGLFTILA